jgi:hypothetical protein
MVARVQNGDEWPGIDEQMSHQRPNPSKCLGFEAKS